jgi:hypothetical protein
MDELTLHAFLARFTPTNGRPKPQADHLPPHHHRQRSSISMDLRKPLSRLFKKVKQKLVEVGRKQDRKSGSGNDWGERETNLEGSQASQRNSHLHLEADDVESGPSQEGNDVDEEEVSQVNPPTSTPSILHSREPNSTQTA